MNKYAANTIYMFFSLLRAGLWDKEDEIWGQIYNAPASKGKEPGFDARGLRDYCSKLDWLSVYNLAMEQTVAGYVGAGLDRFVAFCRQESMAVEGNAFKSGAEESDVFIFVPEKVREAFNNIKFSTGIRNFKMNSFLASLIKEMNHSGINPLLLKGQGVAQNYTYPEIRQAGDIDLLLHGDDYKKAVALLEPKAGKLEKEAKENLHYGMHFGDIEVELHGTVNSNFGKGFNSYLAVMKASMFEKKDFRYWRCEEVDIPLPSANFDAVFIFTHFLNHFYFGGLGLRQICDWAMYLHKNNSDIDKVQLLKDIKALGLMREWQSFGCFVVKYLGFPEEEMPFHNRRFYRNSDKIRDFLFESGNFGRSFKRKDYSHKPYIIRKTMSLFIKGRDIINKFSIFPRNTVRFFFSFLRIGLSAAAKGE